MLGCIGFVLLALGCIYITLLIFLRRDLDWPVWFAAFGVAGVFLLWEMSVSATFRTPLPDDYRKVSSTDNPYLWTIVDEVTSWLGLPSPSTLYVSDGIEAAVFCRINILSVWRKPRYELVLGSVLIDALTADEMRAVLYHEFGHYAVQSLHRKAPVYAVARFSRSFIEVKKHENDSGVWVDSAKTQVALFGLFAFHICTTIDRYFRHIASHEEYLADDVAVRHTSPQLLCTTLAKVSVISHCYRYIIWSKHRMRLIDRVGISMPWLLTMLCRNLPFTADMLPRRIKRRIGRYADDVVAVLSSISFRKQQPAPPMGTVALKRMLLHHQEYCEVIRRSRSVRLRIFLPPRKHRLPLLDARYQLILDGKPIGLGNFIKGYSLDVLTSPGCHVIEAYAVSGIYTIPYNIVCQEGKTYLVEMDYNMHLRNGYYDVFASEVTELA